MKHLKKFNEGFFDKFKNKKDSKKINTIHTDGSEYWAKKIDDNYIIYDKEENEVASIDPDKLILMVYSLEDFGGPVPTRTIGDKIKVRSVEQALEYLQRLDNDKSNSFDSDISNDTF